MSMTKRDLVVKIARETGLTQKEVTTIITNDPGWYRG